MSNIFFGPLNQFIYPINYQVSCIKYEKIKKILQYISHILHIFNTDHDRKECHSQGELFGEKRYCERLR